MYLDLGLRAFCVLFDHGLGPLRRPRRQRRGLRGLWARLWASPYLRAIRRPRKHEDLIWRV